MDILNLFTSFGLLLDIIGAILIYIYGLPSKIEDEKQFVLSAGEIRIPDLIKKEEQQRSEKIKIITFSSQLGIFLIILGFIFQLIGNNLNFFNYDKCS